MSASVPATKEDLNRLENRFTQQEIRHNEKMDEFTTSFAKMSESISDLTTTLREHTIKTEYGQKEISNVYSELEKIKKDSTDKSKEISDINIRVATIDVQSKSNKQLIAVGASLVICTVTCIFAILQYF